MRKGFIQQLARAVWGWLGLCLCCASSFCANVLAFCSRIAGITDWDVEETESGGDSGVPGRRLEDLGLASPSCLCKGIWLSEGFPSPCSQERGLLRGPWGVGSSRALQGRGNRDPGFAKALPVHQRGEKLSSVTKSAGEGSQLISLTAPRSPS